MDRTMLLKNLRIGTKLYLCFAIILLLLVMQALMSWASLNTTHAEMKEITSGNNAKIASANSMRGNMNIIARAIRNLILYDQPEQTSAQKERIAKALASYEVSNSALVGLIHTNLGKTLAEEIEQGRISTMPEINTVVGLIDSGKRQEAAQHLMANVQAPQDKWFNSIERMIQLQEEQNQQSVEQLNSEQAKAVSTLLTISTLAILLGGILAWVVTRSITTPIGHAVSVTQKVARSDLTDEVHVTSKDEVGVLMFALKEMQNSLIGVVSGVRRSAGSVASASIQIAQGNNDLSQRTEEQASALQETAASMEQLSATVKQNADTAIKANNLSRRASEIANEGNIVFSKVTETMADINTSSKNVADIINVIEAIAFQTNILALNAAVEAARAGEQGRGFAVVASEVRNLASRSSIAAKEIKVLISTSDERVQRGRALVDEAGVMMESVVSSIQTVTNLIGDITAASVEQSAGVSQVSEAVIQMDQVTQQNAALVEEMAAAAGSLSAQAQELVSAVSVFQFPEGNYTRSLALR